MVSCRIALFFPCVVCERERALALWSSTRLASFPEVVLVVVVVVVVVVVQRAGWVYCCWFWETLP
ncbi:unnamed protein product [Ectocarpus fasciculatus]